MITPIDPIDEFLTAAERLPLSAWVTVVKRHRAAKKALGEAHERLGELQLETIQTAIAKESAEDKQTQKDIVAAQNARVNAVARAVSEELGTRDEEEFRKDVKSAMLRVRGVLKIRSRLNDSKKNREMAALILSPFNGVVDFPGDAE